MTVKQLEISKQHSRVDTWLDKLNQKEMEHKTKIESLIPTINLTEFDLSHDLALRYSRSAVNLRSRANTWKRKTRSAVANGKPAAFQKWQDDLDARFHRADVAEATAKAISQELIRLREQERTVLRNSEVNAVAEVVKQMGFNRVIEIASEMKQEAAVEGAKQVIQSELHDNLTLKHFQEAINRLREQPEKPTFADPSDRPQF